MRKCGICQLLSRTLQNPFKECIGQPPVAISELLMQCTGIILNIDSGICRQCCAKLSRYYKATQVVHQIERELLELLHNSIVNKELKLKVTSGGLKIQKNKKTCQKLRCKNESRLVETENFIEVFDDVDDTDKGSGEYEQYEEQYRHPDAKDVEFCDLEATAVATAEASTNIDKIACDDSTEVISMHPILISETELETDVDHEQVKTNNTTGNSSTLICYECDMTFPNKQKYRTHIKAKHSAGYICEHCGKTLHSQSGLLAHIQTHDAVKNFVCSECGQRFKTNYLMRLHMAWHTGDRPYECEICHKRYVHSLALYRHKHIHDEKTRRKECKVCGFKFRTSSHLQRHILTHTGAKPHSCPVCGKCFSQRYNMRVHLQEHEQPGSTRQRRLKCKKCTRTFINVENYREHCQRNNCENQFKHEA